MRPELYHHIFSIQTTHWWGRNRRKLSLDLLRRFGVRGGCRHVDIGCGTGQNLGLLASLRPSRVVGLDISPIALECAHKAHSSCELVQLDINSGLPFRDGAFDVATIFNVLYHDWVTSELSVLKEVQRILKVGGLLLVTEPAFASLSRELDVAVMTRRRYRLRPFVELLRDADLEVLFSNYFTSFGAPLILVKKAINSMTRRRTVAAGVPDLHSDHRFLDAILFGLARMEASLLKASVPMPFGTTIICVARKR